jgi:hypothetical protein
MPHAPGGDQYPRRAADHHRRRWRGRHVRSSALRPWTSAILLSIAVLTLGVLGINALTPTVRTAAAGAAGPPPALDQVRARGDTVSRDFARSPLRTAGPVLPAPTPEPPPRKVKPVAGLTQAMMDHAVAIVGVSQDMKLPERAALVAMVTALQESHLRNLANSTVPASLKLKHEGVERNFDSVGIFQQRPSQGWGTVAELMDPETSARRFYERLVRVPNWDKMSVGAAAQAVQRSAFPNAYDKQQPKAQQIVNAIT